MITTLVVKNNILNVFKDGEFVIDLAQLESGESFQFTNCNISTAKGPSETLYLVSKNIQTLRFDNCVINFNIFASGKVRLFFHNCFFLANSRITFDGNDCETFQLENVNGLGSVNIRKSRIEDFTVCTYTPLKISTYKSLIEVLNIRQIAALADSLIINLDLLTEIKVINHEQFNVRKDFESILYFDQLDAFFNKSGSQVGSSQINDIRIQIALSKEKSGFKKVLKLLQTSKYYKMSLAALWSWSLVLFVSLLVILFLNDFNMGEKIFDQMLIFIPSSYLFFRILFFSHDERNLREMNLELSLTVCFAFTWFLMFSIGSLYFQKSKGFNNSFRSIFFSLEDKFVPLDPLKSQNDKKSYPAIAYNDLITKFNYKKSGFDVSTALTKFEDQIILSLSKRFDTFWIAGNNKSNRLYGQVYRSEPPPDSINASDLVLIDFCALTHKPIKYSYSWGCELPLPKGSKIVYNRELKTSSRAISTYTISNGCAEMNISITTSYERRNPPLIGHTSLSDKVFEYYKKPNAPMNILEFDVAISQKQTTFWKRNSNICKAYSQIGSNYYEWLRETISSENTFAQIAENLDMSSYKMDD